MPRPKTKSELLSLSKNNYDKLNNFIDKFSLNEQLSEFNSETMNRNIRDVLAHLHHWHLMMLQWYEKGMSGVKPDMPAKGYTWKTLPDLNRVIWEKYNEEDLNKVRKMFHNSFEEVEDIIKKHTNEELFEKKRYKWTGTTSLGAYLISVTSSHYDWAFKIVKKGKK